ncbi:tyrosine-type recombinase/integrase [Nocardia yunnanensis]|uniref:tyrosine-type recombinase/integrase n=1 Tax=Nocardia yunnanensis TaxID=2382165 RepID=UPI001CA41016|nr:tyrosine-type recombinase/integrase [Nocardia yunnanensis]
MADVDDIDYALRVLAHLRSEQGSECGLHGETPTFAAYISRLRAALPETTVRTYDSYWRVLEREWPDRRLDSPTTTEIDQLVRNRRCSAIVRSNYRGGRGAAANMVAAIRCIYRHAESDRIIRPSENPATDAAKPRKLPSTRHALTFEQVREIGKIASTTGNDQELDSLIVRLHVETACRKGGVLALTVDDLNVDECLIKLREKGETERWQPISPSLMRRLSEHVRRRGGPATTRQVLRYRNGRPVGRSAMTI